MKSTINRTLRQIEPLQIGRPRSRPGQEHPLDELDLSRMLALARDPGKARGLPNLPTDVAEALAGRLQQHLDHASPSGRKIRIGRRITPPLQQLFENTIGIIRSDDALAKAGTKQFMAALDGFEAPVMWPHDSPVRRLLSQVSRGVGDLTVAEEPINRSVYIEWRSPRTAQFQRGWVAAIALATLRERVRYCLTHLSPTLPPCNQSQVDGT